MKFGINKKVSLMSLFILVLFISLMWFSNNVIKQLTDDIELSKSLSQLQQLVELITESSNKYQQNAPRDYESYNRDLKVFYTRFKDNIINLDQLSEKVTHNFFNRKTTASFLVSSHIKNINQDTFKSLVVLKLEFDKGLKEKIGDNEDEPRLEWANDYILGDTLNYFHQVHQANNNFEELLLAYKQATFRFNNLVSLIIVTVFIALIFWINQNIVKRILRIANACKEVSLGNYGLQLKDKKTDEIGLLVGDFNQLSYRLKSILSILSELNNTNNEHQALNVIKKETQKLIGATSLYLLTPKHKTYTIKSVAPDNSQNNLNEKDLVEDDSCLSWIGSEKQFLLINDILAHTISNKSSHMSKYLLHANNINSLLVLKIINKKNTGLLLITKTEKNGFSEQQAETLNSLSSLFGRSLLT